MMALDRQFFRRGTCALVAAGIVVLAGFAAGSFLSAGGQVPSGASAADVEPSGDAPGDFAMHETPRPLPAIGFEDAEGRSLTLADFRGKTVLLNIWATWCAPCRQEMPTLDALQAELGGAGFEVVPLSIDRAGPEVVREFYDEIGIQHLALYIDPSMQAASDLETMGLPTTLLIDGGGREVGRLVGPAEWDTREMVAFLRARIAGND